MQSLSQPVPEFFLQIQRGRTQFPSRPVDASEFLIGGAEQCQLRLGGDQVPAVHSRIVWDAGQIQIEALAKAPALRINGVVATQAILAEGDRVEIGSFEFLVHREPQVADASAETAVVETDLEEFNVEDLKELSAAELVDLIEREQALVDEFESRQQQGALALLGAVRDRMQQRAESSTTAAYDVLLPMPVQETAAVDDGEAGLSEGLQQLLVQLTELSQALEQRSERLSRREAGYAEAVTLLLDAQEKLAQQLEFLAGRISGIHEQQPASQPARAIA